MKTPLLCFTILLLSLVACSPRHDDFSCFTPLSESGWVYGDTLRFTPCGLDSVALRTIDVALRHDNDYPYRNLWLEVTYGTPPSMYRDTVNIELADIYGRWHGKGLGPSYQMSSPVGKAVNLSDSSRVFIRQIMKVDTLTGISQIGIAIRTLTTD